MIFYASPLMKIGKHEWRITVIPSSRYDSEKGVLVDSRSTLYEWRKTACTFGELTYEAGLWRSQRDWPRYNFNDTYLGLPRSLLKLYRRYEAEINAVLDSPPTNGGRV